MAFFKAAATAACLLALPALAAEGPAAARHDHSADAAGAATAAATLSIVSWNLDKLADLRELRSGFFWQKCAAGSWQSSSPGLAAPSCRELAKNDIHSEIALQTKKLAPLRTSLARFAQQGMDILGVQNVRNEAALAGVLPKGYSVVCFTSHTDIDNVGYAARTSLLGALTCREIAPFGEGRAANAMQLTVSLGTQTVSLLNIHLRSGCATGPMDVARSGDCRALQRQVAPLEGWIEAQANAALPFAVLGDWSRDLEQEVNTAARTNAGDPRNAIVASNVRNLFPELNDGVPAGSAMVLAAADSSAAPTCEAHLAHVVLSQSLVDALDPGTVSAGRPEVSLLTPDTPASSGHCALKIDLYAR